MGENARHFRDVQLQKQRKRKINREKETEREKEREREQRGTREYSKEVLKKNL
jgi:hypothetical protein